MISFAVQLGYWKDDFVTLMARNRSRKAPEINRGKRLRFRMSLYPFIHLSIINLFTFFYDYTRNYINIFLYTYDRLIS